ELFKDEIRSLADQGTAILLSSHQMNLVEEMCDRLFLIHRGERVIYGAMDDVKREYANFKCTIYGKNNSTELENHPDVERLEQQETRPLLYFANDIHITS